MLRVPIHKIQPGMVLARPVPLPSDARRYLLQRDREIPVDIVPRLEQLGVLEVWIHYPNLEFLDGLIDEGLGDRQREVYWHVRRNFESIMNGTTVELDIRHFQSAVSELFSFIKSTSRSGLLLQKLDAFDNFLMSHSTNVCYLSLLLGMRLEQYLIDERRRKSAKEAKNLQELSLGCLLHDVGKMHVPVEILNKPGKLTDDEMEVMKLHPAYGYEMVKGRIPPVAAQVVLNHHQRYEGGGYPDRIDGKTGEPLPSMMGKQIPVVCRVATVCDVYDAATTQRIYSAAKLPVQVLHEMRTFCRGFFDPVIPQAFTEIIPPFPLGQVVTLSNGIEAVVVDFNPRVPVSPKVQGLRTPDGQRISNPALEEIDLAIYPELDIVEVDGRDVRPFLDSQRTRIDAVTALV